jgi:predicted ATP-grasp superfamily ATP-dependent carboligase
MSLRLLKSLDWKGIAMVEWKIDVATQRPMLMEINPRFWGSLELAVRAGVDFPYLYALAAAGQPLPALPTYADGVRCRWLIPGEILRFLSQEKSQRETVRIFLSGLPRSAEEWDATDLRGTLAALVCPAISVLNPKYWRFLAR